MKIYSELKFHHKLKLTTKISPWKIYLKKISPWKIYLKKISKFFIKFLKKLKISTPCNMYTPISSGSIVGFRNNNRALIFIMWCHTASFGKEVIDF
jgi:hypothetical protein